MSFTLFKSKTGAVLEFVENEKYEYDLLRYRLDLKTKEGKTIGMWIPHGHPIFRQIQSLMTVIKSETSAQEQIVAEVMMLASLAENGGYTSLEIAHHITDMLHDDLPTARILVSKLEKVREEWSSKPIDDSIDSLENTNLVAPVALRNGLTKEEQSAVLGFIDTLINALKSLLNLHVEEKEAVVSFVPGSSN